MMIALEISVLEAFAALMLTGNAAEKAVPTFAPQKVLCAMCEMFDDLGAEDS